MSSDFQIEICSDVDYEGMVIDISYNMQTIASINYDKGIDQMEIQMFPYSEEKLTFQLQDFLVALEKAKKLALKCAKEDQLNR